MREITLISPRAQDFISGPFLPAEAQKNPLRLAVASLVFFFLGLVACGRSESPSPREKPVLPVLALRDAPEDYTLADPECQMDSGEYRLSTASIQAWDGDKVGPLSTSLRYTMTRVSLVNSAISRTTFGEELKRLCEGSLGPSQLCLDKNLREPRWDTVRPAKDLRICRDGFEFGRQSFESVALTSAYYIQKARDMYLSVAGDDEAPDLIELSVLPQYTDSYVTQNLQGQSVQVKRYLTHNLAYFPDSERIVVFPESKKKAATARGYLWESAFALAHEYGHHIDFERHGSSYREGGLRYNPMMHAFLEWEPAIYGSLGGHRLSLSDDDHSLSTIQSQLAVKSTPRAAENSRYLGTRGFYESKRSLLGSALAEGFADLVAYYTDGATGQSIVGLPGIGKSRDVGSRYFGDGLPKMLTDAQLQVFFGEKGQNDPLTNDSRFADAHTVGAVLAYGADQIFSKIVKAHALRFREPKDSVGQRYLLALLWMEKVTAALANVGPDADRKELASAISQGFESATRRYLSGFPVDSLDPPYPSAELKRDLCLTFEAILPGLEPMPFADAQKGCPL